MDARRPQILIITSRSDTTADYVVLELRRTGASYFRINTEDIFFNIDATIAVAGSSVDVCLGLPKGTVDLSGVKSVWYRRPQLAPIPSSISDRGASKFVRSERRGFLDMLYESIPGLWVSRPHAIRRAENKLLQLREAARIGLRIPQTHVTNSASAAQAFLHSVGDVAVIKPTVDGFISIAGQDKIIYANLIHTDDIIAQELAISPCIFQERLAAILNIRAVVIGGFCCAVEVHPPDGHDSVLDWRHWLKGEPNYKRHELPKSVSRQCITLVHEMGLEFSSMDLIQVDGGVYFFLDLNPNGQWAWFDESLECELRDAMCQLLVRAEQ